MSKNSRIYDVDDACKYGVDGAAILSNIRWNCDDNLYEGINIREGRVWWYHSIKAFQEKHPYFTKNQLEYILNQLEKKGAIVSAYFNQDTNRRCKWYSVLEPKYALNPPSENSEPTSGKFRSCPEKGEDLRKIPTSPSENSERHIRNLKLKNKIKERRDIVGQPDTPLLMSQCDIFIKDVIDYFNQKMNVSYKYKTIETVRNLKRIFKQGHTLENVMTVINFKFDQWAKDPKMVNNLNPSVIFRDKNFEPYLEQANNILTVRDESTDAFMKEFEKA